MRSRRWNLLVAQVALGLAIGFALIFVFSRVVNLRQVFALLGHLNIALALLSGVAFLGAYVVRAVRWRYFLAPYKPSIPRVVGIYQVALFVNWLLPVPGGELVKSLLLRRQNEIPVSESLPTVVMDKMMDLVPAVCLLALLPFLPLQLSRPLWLVLMAPVVVLSLTALCIGLAAWRRQRMRMVLTWALAKLPRPVAQRLEPRAMRFVEALLALIARPRLLLTAAGITVVAVGLDALYMLLAFHAVGSQVSYPAILFGSTLYNLSSILPNPPGQVGSSELIDLLIFSQLLGINRSTVAAMVLFAHPWTALLIVSCGLFNLSAMGLSLRSALALGRHPTSAPPSPRTPPARRGWAPPPQRLTSARRPDREAST